MTFALAHSHETPVHPEQAVPYHKAAQYGGVGHIELEIAEVPERDQYNTENGIQSTHAEVESHPEILVALATFIAIFNIHFMRIEM